MFKIVPNPTFTFPVKLSRPDSDTPVAVTFTFRHKGRAEMRAWYEQPADDPAFLDQVIEGWVGVADAEGKPLPYSIDALRALLDAFPSASREILHAYQGRLSDARAKN